MFLCFLNEYVRKIEKTIIEECVVEDRATTTNLEKDPLNHTKKVTCKRVTDFGYFQKKLKPNLLTIDLESKRRHDDGRI